MRLWSLFAFLLILCIIFSPSSLLSLFEGLVSRSFKSYDNLASGYMIAIAKSVVLLELIATQASLLFARSIAAGTYVPNEIVASEFGSATRAAQRGFGVCGCLRMSATIVVSITIAFRPEDRCAAVNRKE
ncbi:hypothetical protein CC79DRAFT_920783 [Sarocladium strictum]